MTRTKYISLTIEQRDNIVSILRDIQSSARSMFNTEMGSSSAWTAIQDIKADAQSIVRLLGVDNDKDL